MGRVVVREDSPTTRVSLGSSSKKHFCDGPSMKKYRAWDGRMRAATRRNENAVRRPDANCVLHAILGSRVVVWADAGVSGQHGHEYLQLSPATLPKSRVLFRD